MNIILTKTEAETQLAHQFETIASELPGGGRVPGVRSEAMRRLARSGLPHRRVEEWKYTDLRALMGAAYPPARCVSAKPDEGMLKEALGPLATLECIRLVLVNGRVVARAIPAGHEPGAGYEIETLAGSLGQPGFEWLDASLASGDTADFDPVDALNTAFVTDGVVLRVVEGSNLELPIHIVSIVDAAEPVSVATRNVVRVEAGARAVIIESHVGSGIARNARQATAVTQLHVGDDGEAHHVLHVAGGADAVHLGQWHVELGQNAVYRGFQLSAGAGLARHESRIRFTGPDARLDLSGLVLGQGRDHIDTTLVVEHTTTSCESRELFKAVLDDRARAVFQGKIVVAAEAQKTDGKQMAQALMLSADAEFDSKPELEIYADDVACGHGSTAAELDADMLFYLRSRGIPEPQARALLIESFTADALEKIGPEAVRDAVRAITINWLGSLKSTGTPG